MCKVKKKKFEIFQTFCGPAIKRGQLRTLPRSGSAWGLQDPDPRCNICGSTTLVQGPLVSLQQQIRSTVPFLATAIRTIFLTLLT